MSVLVECFSIVVKRSVIESRYPGGMVGYQAHCPKQTLCADENLVRVGFMAASDIYEFLVRVLSCANLVSSPTSQLRDLTVSRDSVAIVEQGRGSWHPNDWLEYAERADGVCVCWLAGHAPGELAAPPGWTPPPPGTYFKVPAEATCDASRAAWADNADERVTLYTARAHEPKGDS